MAIEHYRIYLAAGRSLEAVRECQQKLREVGEAMNALAKEVGAVSTVTTSSIDGFTFKDDAAPEGWKKRGTVDGVAYFAPARRTKADKALWQRMSSLRRVRADDFARLIGRSSVMTEEPAAGRYGLIMRSTTFEMIGNQAVILVPNADKDEAPPPDATPIKASEYWAMREQSQQAA